MKVPISFVLSFQADLYTSCMLGGLCPLIYLCFSIKKKILLHTNDSHLNVCPNFLCSISIFQGINCVMILIIRRCNCGNHDCLRISTQTIFKNPSQFAAKTRHQLQCWRGFHITAITIQIPITIRNICKTLFLLFAQSIDAVCQSKKRTINIGSISQLLTTTMCFRSSFTASNHFYGSTHTIYLKYDTKTVERWGTKNKANELTCQQDPQVQVFL